jgi:hypothetical protein
MEAFFLVVGCAVGLGFMMLHGPVFYSSLFVSRWKKVLGRVVHTAVEEHIDPQNRSARRFDARVDYEYDYSGIVRRGKHFFMRHYEETKEESQARLNAYPVDLELDVYVYMDRPNRSTLTPGINYSSMAQFCFGVIVLALCLFKLAG